MALLSTSVMSTAIPTDFNSIDYSKFSKNYWWLRSPYTNFTDVAYSVKSDGTLSYSSYVNYNSYGNLIRQAIPKFYNFLWLRSPRTRNDDGVYFVIPSGDVDFNGIVGGVVISYGLSGDWA